MIIYCFLNHFCIFANEPPADKNNLLPPRPRRGHTNTTQKLIINLKQINISHKKTQQTIFINLYQSLFELNS